MLRRKLKRQRPSLQNDEENTTTHNYTKKYSKRPVQHEDDDDCEELEKLVFGNEKLGIESLTQLPEIDDAVTSFNLTENPAWVDEDDENLRVDITTTARLRKFRDGKTDVITGHVLKSKLETQFKKLYGNPSWANKSKDPDAGDIDSDEEDDEILQRTGNFLSNTTGHLPKSVLDIVKMKDANCTKPLNASLGCLEFHPSSKVILTAGLNNTLSIFQVDCHTNTNLQSVYVKGFPIHTAHFINEGREILLASQRRHFYCYNIVAGTVTRIPEIRGKQEKSLKTFSVSPDGKHLAFLGKNGYIYILSTKTKQWIADLKMNGLVQAVTFSSDGTRMFSFGGDGDVYIWDMGTRKCLHRFKDDGCLSGTAIAVSPDGRYLACGSDSGVVNIYDNSCFVQELPKPLKTVMNLTTSIDNLKFNHTSEILGISSKVVKNAFKLVHLASLSVFANWPTGKTALKYVQSFDFSPNSGYLSVGNDRGRALLYRLNHYTDA